MTKTMTAAQWKATHRDYKTRIDGRPFVVANNPATGGTELVPVEIIGGAEPTALERRREERTLARTVEG